MISAPIEKNKNTIYYNVTIFYNDQKKVTIQNIPLELAPEENYSYIDFTLTDFASSVEKQLVDQ